MDLQLSRYKRIIKRINGLGQEYVSLDNRNFAAQTNLLRMRVRSGEKLTQILPLAYALVKEAARRVTGLVAFDVQLMGAIAAHEGKLVEMKTGEGKTLTIVFAAYLNALDGKGVHVVTANDYLAERDALWAGKILQLLGVNAGYITSQTSHFDRQVAYAADITYITSNEVCFDFLKDNLIYEANNRRQRGLHYAIIDEADSVLIDEAQTPLVISDNKAPKEKDQVNFKALNKVVKALSRGIDFKVDRKTSTVSLTIEGIKKLEKTVNVENLYAENETDYLYYIERLLKAHYLFKKDKDYVVNDGKVIIVDEFTGRLMHNHRFYQGIHQAIEAKEELEIYAETETMASISFQNFFRRYKNFAGLTGTAASAEKEFRMIYSKQVVCIPTNKPVIREDKRDRFFLTWEDKVNHLAWATQEHFYKKGATLIGTRSVEKSHYVQTTLIAKNIPSNVLNAKHTRREAEVIAQAGQDQTVTVATNMAGRGTDILLSDSVKAQGGLIIYGTERHNAKRIDDQLIGRAGRQGDPGQTQFFVSGDDELIKTHFITDYHQEMMKKKDVSAGVESRKLESLLKKAQTRMENLFFDQRVLGYEFDKVLDVQRESFYQQRLRVLNDDNLKTETLMLIKHEIYRGLLRKKVSDENRISSQKMQELKKEISDWIQSGWLKFNFDLKNDYYFSDALEHFYKSVAAYYDDFENYITPDKMRDVEKITTLKILDLLWVQHLKKVEALQDAAMVSSISRGDFFQQYEIQMARLYKNLLSAVPSVLFQTLFRTMSRMWPNQ